MEINEQVLKDKLNGLEAQEAKLKADLLAVSGAKQLALHLLELLKAKLVEAKDVILEDGKTLESKLNGS